MPLFTFTVTLQIRGPILTRDSDPAGYGVDAPFCQRDGRFCLPGPLVEGKLLEAFRELAAESSETGITEASIVELMGAEAARGEWEPIRGLLHFSDFTGPKASRELLRYRIAINADTRATEEQMLQVLESPFLSGAEAKFTGRAVAHLASQSDAEKIARELQIGFRWVRQLGACRTIGFGTLLAVEVVTQEEQAHALDPSDEEAEALLLRIRPAAPFCFSQHRPRENVMTSSEFIPGAAILGCLARAWERRNGQKAKPAWFDLITASHAFPADRNAETRPVCTPLSVVASSNPPVGTSRWLDFADKGMPCLFDDDAPAFRPDWKDSSVDRDNFGWKRPERDLRVRTAIDPNTRAAEENMLFSQEVVQPDGCDWIARLDFSVIDDINDRRTAVREVLELLGRELLDLGKTKVRATVETVRWLENHRRVPSHTAPRGGRQWIVVLQTAALLCDPRLLAGPGKAASLAGAYAAAWHDISGGALALDHFYARQHLAGGEYLWRRFQGGRPYNPWLLSDAGSVFVLSLNEGAGAGETELLIAGWLARGLPTPTWARGLYASSERDGAHWSRNPYRPQNGYGEIAVNLAHLDMPDWSHGQRVKPIGETPSRPDRFTNDSSLSLPETDTPSSTPRRKLMRIAKKLPERWFITGTFTTKGPLHLGIGNRGWLELREGGPAIRHDANPPNKITNLVVQYHRIARDHKRDPIIPGSAWKGPFRAEFTRLFGEATAQILLGTEELGGCVEFHDALWLRCSLPAGAPEFLPLWDTNGNYNSAIEASVAIDRCTRTASEGKLYYIEFVPAEAVFDVRLTAQGIRQEDIARLLAALQQFDGGDGSPTLGAESSNGWGRIVWTPNKTKRFGVEHLGQWLAAPTACGYDACEAPAQAVTIQPHPTKRSKQVLKIAVELHFRGPLLVRHTEPPKIGKDENIPNARPRRTAEGHALLPARSFRGALRSQAERILRTVFDGTNGIAPEPSLQTEALHDPEEVTSLSLAGQLFGAAGWRSVVDISDFASKGPAHMEEQDFVAIDRFTGGAAEGKKFKWKALWPEGPEKPLTLNGEIHLDLARLQKAENWAPGLLALTLRDLVEGDISFGAGCAKGYGACTADIVWDAESFLTSPKAASAAARFRNFIATRLTTAASHA